MLPARLRSAAHQTLCSYWRELSSELQLRQGGALSIAEILNRMRDGAQLKLQATERELCIVLNALAGQLTAAADEAEAAAAAAVEQEQQQQQQQRDAGGSSSKGRKRGRGSKAAAAAADGDSDVDDDTAWAPGSSDRAAAAAAAAACGGGSSSSRRPKKRVRFAAAAEEEEDAAAAAAAARDADEPAAAAAESPDELRRAALQLLEDSYKVRTWLLACFVCMRGFVCTCAEQCMLAWDDAALFKGNSHC
jgi:hypothetical protein